MKILKSMPIAFCRKMAAYVAVGAMLVVGTACSDDDNDYATDVYFTGSDAPAPVEVIGAAALGTPALGTTSKYVTFNASDNWTITARDLLNPAQAASWVSFLYPSGGKGSQRLGLYASANDTGRDRAATVEVACNGKVATFTLVQQAANPVPNPNAAAIAPGKVVTLVEQHIDGKLAYSWQMGYSSGVLSELKYTDVVYGRFSRSWEIATEGRLAADGTPSINKVTITDANDKTTGAGQMFAVVNGYTLAGCNSTVLPIDRTTSNIAVGYSADHISAYNDSRTSYSFAWQNKNLSTFSYGPTVLDFTYSNLPNDANIDLTGFLLPGIDFEDSHALMALNVLGLRSEKLVAGYADFAEALTFTDGATDAQGNLKPGFTATNGSYTVKVFFAE